MGQVGEEVETSKDSESVRWRERRGFGVCDEDVWF